MAKRRSRSSYEVGAEVMATLLHGPRTWGEVEEQAGLGKETSPQWKTELRKSGVLRISGYREPAGAGRPAAIFSLQAPFAEPDVPRESQGPA